MVGIGVEEHVHDFVFKSSSLEQVYFLSYLSTLDCKSHASLRSTQFSRADKIDLEESKKASKRKGNQEKEVGHRYDCRQHLSSIVSGLLLSQWLAIKAELLFISATCSAASACVEAWSSVKCRQSSKRLKKPRRDDVGAAVAAAIRGTNGKG